MMQNCFGVRGKFKNHWERKISKSINTWGQKKQNGTKKW